MTRPGKKEDDIVIARIVKARGIRGEVACDIATDFPERFEALEEATALMPNGSRLALSLEDHWFHKGRVILKFKGYDSMTAAEQLVGGWLVIAESDTMPLEEDEFYEYDIVGSQAITSEGRVIGQVTALMRTSGHDLLVVQGEDKREHLIPFVDGICTDVDVEARRITIDPPEGLLDL